MTAKNIYDSCGSVRDNCSSGKVYTTKDPLNDVYINMKHIKNVSNNMDVIKSIAQIANAPLQVSAATVSDMVTQFPATEFPNCIMYATDGRKNGETSGNGTGVLCFSDGVQWKAVDTGETVAA